MEDSSSTTIEKGKDNVSPSIGKSLMVKPLLIIFIILLIALIGLVGWQYSFNKKVSEGLQGVYITDITDRSVVVSWVTSQPVKTELIYSTSNIDFFSQFDIKGSKIGYDKRDLEEVDELVYKVKKREEYYVHSVLLRDLDPETQYFFGIKNGIFLNSTEYVNTFTTTKEREDVEAPDIAYGDVLNENGELISDTLLFLNLTNLDDTNQSQVISYVFDGKTGWSADLSNLWDKDLKDKYIRDDSAYLNIRVVNSAGESKKLIKYGDIRPVENISAYNNLSIEEKEEEVKGVLLKNVNAAPPGYLNCEGSGGVWSDGVCTCPSGYKLNSSGYCYKDSPTCTRQSGICACNCPASYSETKPSGEYDTTTVSCPTIDNCGKSCGNPVRKTCYRAKASSCTCRCTPTCPADYPITQNNGQASVERTCTTTDTCGKLCTSSIKCYKAPVNVEKIDGKCGGNAKTYNSESTRWDSVFCQSGAAAGYNPSSAFPQPGGSVSWKCLGKNGGSDMSCTARRETKEIKNIKEEECGYDPQIKQQFYWCECKNGGKSACVSAMYLYNNTNSSCVKYCEMSANSFVKTKICGEGELANCKYGCEEKGPNENDTCKPTPVDIPQEVDCSSKTDMSSCRLVGSSCEWSFAEQKCTFINRNTNCATIVSESKCNLVNNCEFKGGKCVEVNLLNYKNPETDADYCTGLRDKNGNLIPIGYGVGSIKTHEGTSRCSIDVSAMEVNLGNQIPGSNYDSVHKKTTWDEGYKCEVQPYQENGYGYSVIVTQPNGEKIRYAHLKYGSCDLVVTGNSGNQPYHLHIEVACSTPEECASCLGDKNPCKALAGGCFSCSDTVRAESLLNNKSPQAQSLIKSRYLFSLISKVQAAEDEYVNPADLIKDLTLPGGAYKMKVASTSEQTYFVKTDDTHIVFFEDDNANGKLDDEETLLSPYEVEAEYKVSYEKVSDSFELSLQEGFNLVSFPVIFKNDKDQEIRKASELIEFLNSGGINITGITAYRGGKFVPYVLRDGKGFGDDFNILPGEGYFLMSHSNGKFVFPGIKIKDSLEIQLYEGWNLVNIYNSNKANYSGFDVLKQMNSQSINAVAISKWEDSRYYTVASQNGKDYGNDFKVYPTRGYFVRVMSGNGKFSPK